MATGKHLAFERWKTAVGFPPEFPRLGTIAFDGETDDSRLYSPKELDAQRRDVIERLPRGDLRVVVPVGHGATTTARWVVRQVERDCLRMRVIPVLVSLDDLLDEGEAWKVLHKMVEEESAPLVPPPPPAEGMTSSAVHIELPNGLKKTVRRGRVKEAMAFANRLSEAALDRVDPQVELDDAIHAAVVRSLVNNHWERVIGNYRYASLIGADESDDESRRQRTAELLPVVSPLAGTPVDWETVREMSPQLADPAALADVLAGDGIQVSVNLDLSPTRYGRLTVRTADQPELSYDVETDWFLKFLVERFLTHLKNQDDVGIGLFASWNGKERNVVSVTHYLSKGAEESFQRFYSSADTVVNTTTFDPLDVFAIVAAHYSLDRTNRDRPELVSAVINTGVIERAAQSDRFALTSMVHQLDDILKSWGSFTYHAQWPQFRNLPDRMQKLEEDLKLVTGRVETLESRRGDGR